MSLQTTTFENLLEAVPDALLGVDRAGVIRFVNRQTELLFDNNRDELVGQPIETLVPASLEKIHTALGDASMAETGTRAMGLELELKGRHRDGTEFPVDISLSQIDTDDGPLVIAAVHDMTNQIERFESARSMIESSLDSLVAISPDGMITDVNEATVKVTGILREGLIGTAFSDCFTDPDKANAIYQLVFDQGMAVEYPLTMRHQDGTLTEVLYNASVYRDAGGKVLGVFAAARKRIEARVEVSHEDIDHLFTLSLDLLCIAGTDGLLKQINPAWTEVLGYDTDELLGQHFMTLTHPDDLEATEAEFVKVIAGEPCRFFENRFRCKDGSYRWLQWKAVPLLDHGLVYAVARDNTDRKTNEAKFESLLETAPDAMVSFDQRGVIQFVNCQTESLFGYGREDLAGQLVETLAPGSLQTAHLAEYFSGTSAHPAGAVRELTGRRHDGTEFPVEMTLSSIETEDGLMATVAMRDISERQRRDQALKGMAAIIRNSDDAIIGKTLDGIITSWNPAAEKMYGYAGEEIIGKSINLIAHDDGSKVMNAIFAKLRVGKQIDQFDTVRFQRTELGSMSLLACHQSATKRTRSSALPLSPAT